MITVVEQDGRKYYRVEQAELYNRSVLYCGGMTPFWTEYIIQYDNNYYACVRYDETTQCIYWHSPYGLNAFFAGIPHWDKMHNVITTDKPSVSQPDRQLYIKFSKYSSKYIELVPKEVLIDALKKITTGEANDSI